MELLPGELIENKYRIVGLLGTGGMGAVYEGLNILIERRVAIKVLHIGANADAVERFHREAQAAGKIGNDHILEVLDLGSLPSGDRYMVMEFLDGETLTDRIRRVGRMSPGQALPIFRQVLAGLHAVHEKGIVHRDLKPDNIFILKEKAGRKDFVKIIDFGISKFSPLNGEFSKTRTGAVMGTPYYMSPEQATGSRDVDRRTDLYAVGVILYEATTGQVPFDGETFNQLMFKIALSDAPRPGAIVTDLPPAYEAVIVRGMARDSNDRYQTAAEFEQALVEYQRLLGSTPPPPSEFSGAVPPGQTAVLPTANAHAWAQSQSRASAVPIQPVNAVLAQSGSAEPLTSSGAAWGQSQVRPPRSSAVPLLIAGATIGSVLLVGGVVLALTRRAPVPEVAAVLPPAPAAPAVASPTPPATPAVEVVTPTVASIAPSAAPPDVALSDAKTPDAKSLSGKAAQKSGSTGSGKTGRPAAAGKAPAAETPPDDNFGY